MGKVTTEGSLKIYFGLTEMFANDIFFSPKGIITTADNLGINFYRSFKHSRF